MSFLHRSVGVPEIEVRHRQNGPKISQILSEVDLKLANLGYLRCYSLKSTINSVFVQTSVAAW